MSVSKFLKEPLTEAQLEKLGLKPGQVGGTGQHPHGRINADDKGELTLGVAADKANQVVHIAFGDSISWLGLDKQTALQFGQAILDKANELR